MFFTKVKLHLKWKVNDVLFSTGLKKISNSIGPVCSILVYHGVDAIGNTNYNSRFISECELEKQFLFFKEQCNVISLEDYYKNNFHPARPNIVITFDDGYANNLNRALPLLEKYKLPATFFITAIRDANYDILWSDCVDLSAAVCKDAFEIKGERFFYNGKKGYVSSKTGMSLKHLCKTSDFNYKKELMNSIPGYQIFRKNKKFDEYWHLLTDDEIKKLASSDLITIGSHGYYHNCLDRIPLKDAEWELIKSRSYLENILQKEVTALAFPDGSFSKDVIETALKSGYSKLLSTNSHLLSGKETDVLKTRFEMNHHISLNNQLMAIFKNSYL